MEGSDKRGQRPFWLMVIKGGRPLFLGPTPFRLAELNVINDLTILAK